MGQKFSKGWNESYFITPPTLTEKNLADQTGRVHFITGAYSGCGYELARLLYQKNASVYIAGRNAESGTKAIAKLREAFPQSTGTLEFVKVDLSDFQTIKPAVDGFLAKQTKLHVLTNNAGVMNPPKGSVDAQGNELQLGTNCVGHYLLAKLLLPTLINTAKTAPPNSVRITWASSATATFISPPNGVAFEGDAVKYFSRPEINYGQSKAGNVLLAYEFAQRYGKHGLVSVSFNPGNLKTNLLQHSPAAFVWIVNLIMLYPAIYGGYTELWAACSDELDQSKNGAYISPWGRITEPRTDIVVAMKLASQGGTGTAEKFFEFCDSKTTEFAT